MYYNTDFFTAEDVVSLDKMLEKGKVSFPMSTAWYGGAIFIGNGGTLFGEKANDAAAGIQFGGENGYAAAKKMVEIANHPNFVDDASGAGVSGLKNGTIGAAFTGSWDKAPLVEALGDKLAAAQPPKVTIDGKEVQMKAFAGSKCVGVNPNCENQKVAMMVAAFLASEESQLARYEMRGIIPAHKALASNETISKDFVAVAEMNTMNNGSCAQPTIPEMANYWNPMGSFGNAVVNKDVTEENYKDMVDQFMTQLNASGL
jgi:arabinogalactan oligomer/maltooligosaccharide transport system substrate-binding protein